MQSCINVLDRYVAELRSYMKRFPWAAGPDVSATRAAAPAEEEAQRDEWEQLSAEVRFRRFYFGPITAVPPVTLKKCVKI